MFVLPPLNCKLLGQGLFLIQYLSSTSTTIFIRDSLCSWHTNINSKLDSICFCNSSPLEKDSTPGSWNLIRKDHDQGQPRVSQEMSVWDVGQEFSWLCPSLYILTCSQSYKGTFPNRTHSHFFFPHISSLQKIVHVIYIGSIDWSLS